MQVFSRLEPQEWTTKLQQSGWKNTWKLKTTVLPVSLSIRGKSWSAWTCQLLDSRLNWLELAQSLLTGEVLRSSILKLLWSNDPTHPEVMSNCLNRSKQYQFMGIYPTHHLPLEVCLNPNATTPSTTVFINITTTTTAWPSPQLPRPPAAKKIKKPCKQEGQQYKIVILMQSW